VGIFPSKICNFLMLLYTKATSKAMIDALQRLLQDRETCCQFCSIITGDLKDTTGTAQFLASESLKTHERLNSSQISAVQSCGAPLSLIWGPPGMLRDQSHSMTVLNDAPRNRKNDGCCPDTTKTPD
jgi:regulator of nonsense transcripts 1